MLKVSVLMPTYNAEPYVKDAIESILSQSLADFEFIIIDDGSTDGTTRIIQKYASSDPRIKFFANERNLGISATRNKLVSLAQGEFVAWQDADDISAPGRLSKQFELMQGDSTIGICGGDLEFFDDKNKVLSTRKYRLDDKELRKRIFRFSPVAQPAAMLRREVFEKVGEYDVNLAVAEDIDMSFRVGRHYKFANVDEVVLRYRQHSGSATFQKLKEIEVKTMKIRKKYFKDKNYNPSIFDYIFNLGQLVTLHLFPAKARIRIFNSLRNSSSHAK